MSGLLFSVFNEDIRKHLLLIWSNSDKWHLLLVVLAVGLFVLSLFFWWRIAQLKDHVSNLEKSNAKLILKLDTDQKSGLSSYEFLKNQVRQEYLPSVKKGADFSVLMIDLVDFKEVNDVHGHDVGDAVISFVGGFLKAFVRGRRDMAARFGEAADEFFIVVEGDRFALSGFANRLRRELEDEQLNQDNGLEVFRENDVSVSFWSAGTIVTDSDNWESIRKRLASGLVSVKKTRNAATLFVEPT